MRARRSAGLRALFLLLFLCCVASGARGEDAPGARVEGVAFARAPGGDLTVSFQVVNANSEAKLVETVESGLPVRFIYRTRLVRTSAVPFGGIVGDLSFERTLEKDNLKNRYRVTQGERTTDFPTMDQALALMGKVEGFAIAQAKDLRSRESYRAEIQVKLEEFRLPFHLHRILPFMNFWDVTTPWTAVPVPAELLRKP